jgi:hypothetical protein
MPLLEVPVTFKELYSSKNIIINVNPHFTTKQMIDTYSDIIQSLFHCDEFVLIPTNHIHVVNNNMFPPEANYILEKTNDRLRDLYGSKLNVSFYVKDINKDYDELTNKNILFKKSECFVCFDQNYLCNRFSCQHFICDNCYIKCFNYYSEYRCPQCRKSRENLQN